MVELLVASCNLRSGLQHGTNRSLRLSTAHQVSVHVDPHQQRSKQLAEHCHNLLLLQGWHWDPVAHDAAATKKSLCREAFSQAVRHG